MSTVDLTPGEDQKRSEVLKIRAQMLREAAAELTNLAEAYHANGGPLIFPQPCCQTAVRVAAAYLDSWAKKSGPFPSWKEREEGREGNTDV